MIAISDYGLEWPAWTKGRRDSAEFTATERIRLQLDFQREAFATRRGPGFGCPPRPVLFRSIADTLVPGWFEWHAWTNRIIDAGCRRRWMAIAGCSNSAKTRNVAGFACTWWLAAPQYSSVIFCSTTMKSLRKRGWAEVQNYFNSIGGDYGNFVDSRTVWQNQAGDDRHAIYGMAVQEGDLNKTAANIQGIHTRRQLVVIDEAEAVSTAIWKACANLYSYPVDAGGEFILIAIANPRSRLSQFGRFIEPENGYDSVSVETDEWESKPQMDGKRALVIRLDFTKSPNVLEKRIVSKHLPTTLRVVNRMAALKARGAENDPDHWCYDRGFPPPEGLSQTVFTDSLISSNGGYGRFTFTGNNFRIIGAFDQAFGGGDRPALRFGAMGEIDSGKMGIEWLTAIMLFPDATVKTPVRYQLRDKIIAACKAVQYRDMVYSCDPENFAVDCTGDGGLGDILEQTWSPKIIRIMFSGACSVDPVSKEDVRPANEVYRNKRAEMYFRSRTICEGGQLRGIDTDTAEELCTLEYSEFTKDGRFKLITLQDKKEYKLKFTKSPDLADCGIMLTEVARLKGFRIAEVGHTILAAQEQEKMVESAAAAYHVDYTQEQEHDLGDFAEDEAA